MTEPITCPNCGAKFNSAASEQLPADFVATCPDCKRQFTLEHGRRGVVLDLKATGWWRKHHTEALAIFIAFLLTYIIAASLGYV